MKLVICKLFMLIIISLISACLCRWYVIYSIGESTVQGAASLRFYEVKKLMRYHGTDYAWLDSDNRWKFKRDGTVCKLKNF